mgnify:CR=1 FL=1
MISGGGMAAISGSYGGSGSRSRQWPQYLLILLPLLTIYALVACGTLPSGRYQLLAYLLGCVLEAAKHPEEALQVFHGVLQKDFHYADVEERYRRLKPVAAEAARTRAAATPPGTDGV